MTTRRVFAVLPVIAIFAVACGSPTPTIPDPESAKSDVTQTEPVKKPAQKPVTTTPAKTTEPADVEPPPLVVQEPPAQNGDDDDDDGTGTGQGGDARCCVGTMLWVCHASGSNGASCNANLTPPGDNCESLPLESAECR